MFLPALLLPMVLPLVAPFLIHPHHPKALVVGGAAGKVSVLYFTVPYNAEHLADAKPGMSWHLGFSSLKTEVPLRVGDVEVPAGDYKLSAQLTDDGWNLSLQNLELATAKMMVQFGRGARKEAGEKRVAELEAELAATGGDKVLALAARSFPAADEEHLAMTVIHHGFTTVQRGSDEAADGVEFALRVSFGDLHREIRVKEVFAGAEKEAGPGRDRR